MNWARIFEEGVRGMIEGDESSRGDGPETGTYLGNGNCSNAEEEAGWRTEEDTGWSSREWTSIAAEIWEGES